MLDHSVWYSRGSDYVFIAEPKVIDQGHIGSKVWGKFPSEFVMYIHVLQDWKYIEFTMPGSSETEEVS